MGKEEEMGEPKIDMRKEGIEEKNKLGGGIKREVMRKIDGEGIEKEERIWTEDRRRKKEALKKCWKKNARLEKDWSERGERELEKERERTRKGREKADIKRE